MKEIRNIIIEISVWMNSYKEVFAINLKTFFVVFCRKAF